MPAAAARTGRAGWTLRLRLTALYGAVFLASGAVLLVITYALLYVNVAVFLAGLLLAFRNNVGAKEFLFPSTDKALQIIHQTGAMSGPDVYLRHQWWRFQ